MRASKDLLLAIDQGTQSVRAMIFDCSGELLAKSQVHIQPYFSRTPGWAEQDPQDYWRAVTSCTRQLLADSHFTRLLKAESLDSIPQRLAMRVTDHKRAM